MNDKNNLKSVFGEADERFKHAVFQTLEKLERDEETKPVKKFGLRFTVIVAIVCLMLTTTVVLAMTNAWGIMDFLTNRRVDVNVLPEASHIIQKDVEQSGGKIQKDVDQSSGKSEITTFSLRQAVFDGKNVYLAIEVKPSDPQYLLCGFGVSTTDPIANLGPLFKGKEMTVAEYAIEQKKKPLYTSIGVLSANGESAINNYSLDYVLEEDGTLVYMLSGYYNGTETTLPMELSCSVAQYYENPIVVEHNDPDPAKSGITTLSIDPSTKQTTTLSFTLKQNVERDEVSSVSPVEYGDVGVCMDKVTLTRTPMAIYTEVNFTIIDQEKYDATDGGLWFEFVDKNGERLPDGASNGGSINSVNDSKVEFVQIGSIKATDALPSEIILRGYNCWDKTRYEAHTIEMN